MTDRGQFEKWAKSKQEIFFGGTFSGEQMTTGQYFHDEEESAWQAWQASRAVPVRLPRPFYDDDSYPIIYADRAADAIRQAGYKVEGDT
jgi:hypothetical protein